MSNTSLLRCVLAMLAASMLGGCAGLSSTPAQLEAAKLRRYCEIHPEDSVKCLGFTGFL